MNICAGIRSTGQRLALARVKSAMRSVLLLVLGTVGGAAALALAAVLAFASVVAGRATAVSFTGILAFAGVLVGLLGVRLLAAVDGCGRRHCGCTCEEPCESCTHYERTH